MLSTVLDTMCWQLAAEDAPTTWGEVAYRLGVPLYQVERWRRGEEDNDDDVVGDLLARWNGVSRLHSIRLDEHDGQTRICVGPPSQGAEVVLLFG